MKNSKSVMQNTAKALAIPVLIFAVLAVTSGGRTFSLLFLNNTLRQSIVSIIICWGLMMNMSMGMVNFSGGGVLLTAGIIGGNLAMKTGTGVVGFVLFSIAIGMAVGAITGLLYNLMRVPAMVLTIGTMLIWESLPKLFFPEGIEMSLDMTVLSRPPYLFIIALMMLVLFHLIYNQTVFGHNMRAIGNNQGIANSVGLNSDKIKFASFVIGGLFLGVAAFLYIGEKGTVRNVAAMGSFAIMMDGFMGLFIANFLSRYCNMSFAVVIGTFSMKLLTNGLVALGFSATVRSIFQGLFLLVLLIIAANTGMFERRRANRQFARQADREYESQVAATS